LGGTSLRTREGRDELQDGNAFISCPTGGWREDPAEKEEEFLVPREANVFASQTAERTQESKRAIPHSNQEPDTTNRSREC
jgi:hypothetical protein